MKFKDILFDVWLALGVLGMVIGLAIPVLGTFYTIWEWIQ